MEPVVVKTVSKNKLSDEKLICASLLVIKESFLQEKMKRMAGTVNSNNLFIGFKNSDFINSFSKVVKFEKAVKIAHMQA